MPLTMMDTGETSIIKKIGGRGDTRNFLENLGFVVGGAVTVVSRTGGNLIVNVKEQYTQMEDNLSQMDAKIESIREEQINTTLMK